MDNLLNTFLLLLAAIVALITYVVVQAVPVAVLASVAAVALAIGVWWHWTQFSVEYRTSTWQEQLRGYASYALLLTVILLSYGFYAFTAGGGSIGALASQARNAGRRATSQVSDRVSRITSAIVSDNEDLPEVGGGEEDSLGLNFGRNLGL